MSALDARSQRFSELRWVPSTTSTNSELLELARGGSPELALGADYQTAGRGRLGRRWVAPRRAALLLSVLIRPRGSVAPHLYGLGLGCALLEALHERGAASVRLKWPNDVVVASGESPLGYRKLAGILGEQGPDGSVVVGVGCNIDFSSAVPSEIAATAIDLAELGVVGVQPEALARSILERFGLVADEIEDGGGEPLVQRAASMSLTIGQHVRVETASGVCEGEAVGYGRLGELLVHAGGTVVEVQAGDVTHLRPTSPERGG
jgi:BirA family biotin operon repressor/biotin-[acetyl-CoA-carboxylase] ligase